jgi:molybdate transport system substrate-binding protein
MRLRRLLLCAFCWLQAFCARGPGQDSVPPVPKITVAAASDLTLAFHEIGQVLQSQERLTPVFSFGSSGLLAKQIEQGAPFDVFAAASEAYVNQLREKNLIRLESQRVFAQGSLVIWQRHDIGIRVDDLSQLTLPGVRRIAIANPEHAPYGMAAREALQWAGVWERVQTKIILGENVVQALQFAQTGNVEAAIVARALASRPGGRSVSVALQSHSPINQTICILQTNQNLRGSQLFLEFLLSPEGAAILERHGFTRAASLPGEAAR